jgi:hypothetical protein
VGPQNGLLHITATRGRTRVRSSLRPWGSCQADRVDRQPAGLERRDGLLDAIRIEHAGDGLPGGVYRLVLRRGDSVWIECGVILGG